ncbi:putative chromosome 1 ORF-a, related protein, partial [Toxoplasma gondii CAST]
MTSLSSSCPLDSASCSGTVVTYIVPTDGPVRRICRSSSSSSSSSSSASSSASSSFCSSTNPAEGSSALDFRKRSLEEEGEKGASQAGWKVKTFRGSVGASDGSDASLDAGAGGSIKQVTEGKYEGGLALWECTWDLVRFLLKLRRSDLQDAHVLDLGCGHGLAGLLMIQRGAGAVVFQDLNEEVLLSVTAPTVALNMETADEVSMKTMHAAKHHKMRLCRRGPDRHADAPSVSAGCPAVSSLRLPENCLLLPASWEAFPPLCCSCSCSCSEADPLASASNAFPSPCALASAHSPSPEGGFRQNRSEAQFDWILASECIYRPKLFETLRQLFKTRLKRGSGKAVVAGKRYYFGLGGGTLPFLHFLRKAESEERERRRAAKGMKGCQERQQGRESVTSSEGSTETDVCMEDRTYQDCDGGTDDELEVSVALAIEDKTSNVRDILLIEKKNRNTGSS